MVLRLLRPGVSVGGGSVLDCGMSLKESRSAMACFLPG